jgi:hypothetical protein
MRITVILSWLSAESNLVLVFLYRVVADADGLLVQTRLAGDPELVLVERPQPVGRAVRGQLPALQLVGDLVERCDPLGRLEWQAVGDEIA